MQDLPKEALEIALLTTHGLVACESRATGAYYRIADPDPRRRAA